MTINSIGRLRIWFELFEHIFLQKLSQDNIFLKKNTKTRGTGMGLNLILKHCCPSM